MVGDRFRWQQRTAAARWRELAGTGLAINDLPEVVMIAALASRVEAILIPMDAQR